MKTSVSLALIVLALTQQAVAGPAVRPVTTITGDFSVVAGETFDYVIAGGGLAGLVVANKLAEEGNSVVVLEAGPDLKDDASFNNAATRTANCNWKYTASNEDGTDLGKLVDSGRCLGGSTSINGMVWFRPDDRELDALNQLGNTGWGANDLNPYIIDVEANTVPNAIQISQGAGIDTTLHGYNGLVNTSFSTPMRIPVAQSLYKSAFQEVFPSITNSPDLSQRPTTGSLFSSTLWTIWYDAVAQINKRSSAAHAFLYASSQQRASETVVTGALVQDIVWSATGTRARGLRFVPADADASEASAVSTVYARKEVLLAAGALASAPILERSGVGAASVLQAAGVTQVVDLPGVGLNLQDQPGGSLSGQVNSANVSNSELQDGVNIFGPVIALPGLNDLFGTAEASSIITALETSIPTLAQQAVTAGAVATVAGAEAIFTAVKNLLAANVPAGEIVGESYPWVMTGIFWPTIPLSRGHIHIKSASPYDAPTITPRFLTSGLDGKIGGKLSQKVREIFSASAFEYTVANPAANGPATGSTDQEWANWFKDSSYGASHWVGSTTMMPQADGGVVSSTLNVYGTECLRVVDAGIFGVSFTSHTMPIVYAGALKAADLIKGNSCN